MQGTRNELQAHCLISIFFFKDVIGCIKIKSKIKILSMHLKRFSC